MDQIKIQSNTIESFSTHSNPYIRASIVWPIQQDEKVSISQKSKKKYETSTQLSFSFKKIYVLGSIWSYLYFICS